MGRQICGAGSGYSGDLMLFKETKLKGAYVVELDRIEDKRGFLARSFCQKEFKKNGLNFNIVQSSVSYNKKRGTIRGMHFQTSPYEEAKLVMCVKGELYDVIIDLRKNSPTYGKWFSIKLTETNYKSLYIPEGFAHGFQTLEDNTVILYQMSEFYYPESSRGIRWNDPAFRIKWPMDKFILSHKDKGYKDFMPVF